MTYAKVRAIYTSSMDELEKYVPEDPERFCVSIRAIVGPKIGDGEESFDIQVCSPKRLEEICKKQGFVIGRHYLIVCRYDVTFIKKVVTDLIEKCEGSSWAEVAEKVGRIGYWEFEDYKSASRPLV